MMRTNYSIEEIEIYNVRFSYGYTSTYRYHMERGRMADGDHYVLKEVEIKHPHVHVEIGKYNIDGVLQEIEERKKELDAVIQQYPLLKYHPEKVVGHISKKDIIPLAEWNVSFDEFTEDLQNFFSFTRGLDEDIAVYNGENGQYTIGLCSYRVAHCMNEHIYFSDRERSNFENFFFEFLEDYLIEAGLQDMSHLSTQTRRRKKTKLDE